jgi:threonine synthase
VTSPGLLPARLHCVLCGAPSPARVDASVCPRHQGLAGILDATCGPGGDIGDAGGLDALDRYRALLPMPAGSRRLPSGYLPRTPLLAAPRLARELGVAELFLKDESRNPTGSLKDRSSALAVELAAFGGYRDLACASTGNAASSLAGACAATGLTAWIFVPAGTPDGKLAQLAAFDARVLLVRGSYDDAYYLCEEAVAEFGWYDRNCAVNPYLVEGKKTCALEIAEQLEGAEVDWLSVSVGDGCTVAALGKGLTEMARLGRLAKVPRLLAAQPAGAAPIVAAWERGTEDIAPVPVRSAVDSVAVGRPRNAVKALRAVRDSDGAFVAVPDEETAAAARMLGRLTGVFAEPGAAAGIAAIARARADGLIRSGDRVVHVVTGSGLKAVRPGGTRYPEIEPTLAAVRGAVGTDHDGGRE